MAYRDLTTFLVSTRDSSRVKIFSLLVRVSSRYPTNRVQQNSLMGRPLFFFTNNKICSHGRPFRSNNFRGPLSHRVMFLLKSRKRRLITVRAFMANYSLFNYLVRQGPRNRQSPFLNLTQCMFSNSISRVQFHRFRRVARPTTSRALGGRSITLGNRLQVPRRVHTMGLIRLLSHSVVEHSMYTFLRQRVIRQSIPNLFITITPMRRDSSTQRAVRWHVLSSKLQHTYFKCDFMSFQMGDTMTMFVFRGFPGVPRNINHCLVSIRCRYFLPPLNYPSVGFVPLWSSFSSPMVLFTSVKGAILLRRFIRRYSRHQLSNFFHNHFSVMLLQVMVLFRYLFRPLFLQFYHLSKLVNFFRMKLRFTNFVIMVKARFIITGSFTFSLFNLIVPGVKVSNRPNQYSRVCLSTVPRAYMGNHLQFYVVTFCTLFSSRDCFRDARVPS